jgi:subtilisin family serine protease
LGPNYNLRSNGSLHDRYLQLLNVPAYRSAKSAKIAVVDSGFEKPGSLSGFLDLVDPRNSTEKDTFGHGTAIASIIADVAPGADVYSVRASDQGPHVSEAMLGVAAASFHFAADIINLSFGMPYAQSCTACGSASGVSKVFFRLLRSLSEKPMSLGEPPILVAATGNDGLSTGFDAPALWNFTLAVGSINKKTDRSTFSNYGSSGQTQYVMMPGGEESQGTISEWIGQAKQKCFGTSAAAAYASGMLALYLAHPSYKGLDRATFLATVLGQCKPCRGQNRSEHGHGYLTFN